MKEQYLGNNLGSPNSHQFNEHFDWYETIDNIEDWRYIIDVNYDGKTCKIKGLTINDAAQLLYSLERNGELKVVRSGGYGDGNSYALHFSDEELAYPIDEYAYDSEIGLFHKELRLFKCNECGKILEIRSMEESFPHGKMLLSRCDGTYFLE